jgi:biotin carboxyl carrier protein
MLGEYMDTKTLSDFIKWSKTTDLQEIIYRKNGTAVEIKTAPAVPQASDFSSKLQAVTAPAVGIYHSGKKGKEITIKENMTLAKNHPLGVIQTNNTETEITAPCGGKLKIIGISNGQSAQYGQPLFFIEAE